jgi:hypothetical protein
LELGISRDVAAEIFCTAERPDLCDLCRPGEWPLNLSESMIAASAKEREGWRRRSRTATKDQPLLSSDARAHRRSFVANKISRHIDTNRSTMKYVDSDRVCTRSLLQLSWRSVTAASAFLDRFPLVL